MKVLAIDVGSSSIKASILTGPGALKQKARRAFDTRYDEGRAEVDPAELLKLTAEVIEELGPGVKGVDCIIPTGMAPSWVAMDARGRPITPIVTHQDRRSLGEAADIEERVGKSRHLKIAGNRPVAGGISSTTTAWFARHEPAVMKRADLIGHLTTLLTRTFCNARAIDTSNASFTGLYATTTLGGWHDELLSAAGVSAKQLPEVVEADAVVGSVTAAAAARFGLTEGTPMLAGIMDGSCAMLLAGAKAGQVVNVVGSTDVLAVCTDTAMPDPAVLTRALGRGKRWLSVGTLAASGTAIDWARKTFFADLGKKDFKKLMTRLINQPADPQLVFRPTLAGSRTSNDLPAAEITGLKLAHTRDDILRAMLEGLAVASAERFGHFQRLGLRMRRDVLSTGGGNDILATLLRRDWPGRWTFREEEDATLRGVWMLAESAK